ncbi:MAG: hypothetical protein V1861_05195 [Candidatus Micrarchaeota archaeon]
MAHYSLLVKYEGTIEEAGGRVEKMLEPYCEDMDDDSDENPDAKWDWYDIGGGYKGLLKLKKDWPSKFGYPPNSDRVERAYAKDVDLEGLWTVAVLDKDGFHEPTDMYDDEEMKSWAKDYKTRFLADISDRTVLVIVDLHI